MPSNFWLNIIKDNYLIFRKIVLANYYHFREGFKLMWINCIFSENFVFLLIRDWFTLRWSVNVNLKKNMKRKTFPHFFVCFTTPPGVAKFMEKFQSYWKVKIIIIICDDEHNPSFLNDDDYFQMMSWRSSFCDLQNFLRQPFFFF